MRSDDVSLAPCPFCGSREVRVYQDSIGRFDEGWRVGCRNSECLADGPFGRGGEYVAVALWNRRASGK